MSREYVVLVTDEPKPHGDIDGQSATIFMRFTERPDDGFMQRDRRAVSRPTRLLPARRIVLVGWAC